MKVFFTVAAELLDLDTIADWIAEIDTAQAERFIQRLRQACDNLGPHPLAYPRERRYADQHLRRRVFENYLIFYRVRDQVEIVRILHGARDYDAVLRGEGS